MGHKQDGDAALPVDAQELILQLAPGDLVHRAERLVHQQKLRTGGQRPGDTHPLALSAGEGAGIPPRQRRVQPHLLQQGLQVEVPAVGTVWQLGSATVTMLGPVAQYSETNDTSIVLRVDYGATSFLLTGDMESDAERDLVNSGANLKADVLQVGHHGSSTSTSYLFLNAVLPEMGVISCGTGNVKLSGLRADDISIEAGMGNITLDQLICKKLTVSGGTGGLTLRDGEASESAVFELGTGTTQLHRVALHKLDLSAGVGSLSLSGTLRGDCEIELGVGSSDIHLLEPSAHYSAEIERGLGSLSVSGANVLRLDDETEAISPDGNADCQLKIQMGMGSLALSFDP